jgi:hypothetical protein
VRTKKNLKSTVLLIIFVTTACQWWGCQPLKPTEGVTFTITGEVRDAKTDAGIPNVTVQFGAFIFTTDVTGTYKAEGLSQGSYNVTASKQGYLPATTPADISEFNAVIRTLYLVPFAPSVIIGPDGSTITTPDDEGDVFQVSIPPGAIDRVTRATATPLQGLDIPGIPPQRYLSIATVHIGVEGVVGVIFVKPVTLTVPLPVRLEAETEIPLFAFDPTTREWKNTGTRATVNPDGLTASAEVTPPGTFSVMPEVRVEEISRSSEIITRQRLPGDATTFVRTFRNFIEFSEDAGIDRLTLTQMIEQLEGVSFLKPTTINLSFASAEERNRLREEDDVDIRLIYVEERVRTTFTMTIFFDVARAGEVAAAPMNGGNMASGNSSQNNGSQGSSADPKHDQGTND